MNGYIKTHRQILDWEWYSDINTRVLFIHLLLKANYEDKRWRGMVIKKGQLLVSPRKLAEEIGISYQSTRTSLDKLVSTGEITKEPTQGYTLLSICNYCKYQSEKNSNNARLTHDQRTSNAIFNAVTNAGNNAVSNADTNAVTNADKSDRKNRSKPYSKRISRNSQHQKDRKANADTNAIFNADTNAGNNAVTNADKSEFLTLTKEERKKKESNTQVCVLPKKEKTHTLTHTLSPSSFSSNGFVSKPDVVEEQIWFDYLKVLKAKNQPLTRVALNHSQEQAKLSKINLNEALRFCVIYGWSRFESVWYRDRLANPKNPGHYPLSAEEQSKHLVDGGVQIPEVLQKLMKTGEER